MRLQLKDGVRLRHPVTRRLVGPEPFTASDRDLFWVRRLRDGDVVRVAEPPAAPAAAPAPKPAQPAPAPALAPAPAASAAQAAE